VNERIEAIAVIGADARIEAIVPRAHR